MADELISFWGFQTGWCAQHADGFQVSANLDGINIWYWHHDCGAVYRAFNRAARRTFLRRYLRWLSPPRITLKATPTYSKEIMTVPSERSRAVVLTRTFLEQLAFKTSLDIPDSVREHALLLLRHYPGHAEIHLTHSVAPEWWGPVEVKTHD